MAQFTLSDDSLSTLQQVLQQTITDTQKKLAKAKREGDYKRIGAQLAAVIELQDIFAEGDGLPKPVVDFTVTGEGSVFHVAIDTDAALDYVKEQFQVADWQWLGPRAFAVEHRIAPPMVAQLRDAGFAVVVR